MKKIAILLILANTIFSIYAQSYIPKVGDVFLTEEWEGDQLWISLGSHTPDGIFANAETHGYNKNYELCTGIYRNSTGNYLILAKVHTENSIYFVKYEILDIIKSEDDIFEQSIKLGISVTGPKEGYSIIIGMVVLVMNFLCG